MSQSVYQLREYKTAKGHRPFGEWVDSLDTSVRARVMARLERIEQGNLGDSKGVGGVFELRLKFGPGYRIYYGIIDNKVVLLLVGGDKSTQKKDIKRAKEYWDDFRSFYG